jgi:hypothetical protein
MKDLFNDLSSQEKNRIMEMHRRASNNLYLSEQNSNYRFWDSVIDTFLPGTPVKDGRDLLSKFDAIIKRRIEYNKKNKLPSDTLTPEERTFREKILKATPNFGYPSIYALAKIIQDINSGKNIQPQELEHYKNVGSKYSKYNDQDINQMLDSRNELKRMWLGIDDTGDEKGYWVKSEFKPATSTNPNVIYYKPKNIPKLTTQQFDELYTAIMKTRKSDGKFPGGNSSILFNNFPKGYAKFRFIDSNTINKLRGDLGHFKFGAAEENGKKYISIYDEWNLVPPSIKKFDVDIQRYGKTPLIYYRIYR